MKIFNKHSSYGSCKVNFVDENNVVLGYDMTQYVCEDAGWFLSDRVLSHDEFTRHQSSLPENEVLDLPGWEFDTNFRKSPEGWGFDYVTIFRITDGDQEKFIYLYNHHDGYYTHGFQFRNGEDMIDGGYI